MKRLTINHCLVFAAFCLLISACSREKPKAAGAKSRAPLRQEYQALGDVSDPLQKKAETFARKIEKNLRDSELRAVCSSFDMHSVVEGVFEGTTASTKLNQFKLGLSRGMQTGIEQAANSFSQQAPKFKGLTIYKGELAARFRFVSDESGISIIDFVLRTNLQGSMVIVNFCNHALGYDMVDQSRQMIAPVLAEFDKSFIERVVNKPDVTVEEMKQFGLLSEKFRAQDYKGVVEMYRKLPYSLQDALPACGIYILALQRMQDAAAYGSALKKAALRFNSANFQFMLVDVYAMEKQYDKAADCVDAFMQRVGKDAALLALKSLMLNAKGDVKTAREALRESLELEPDCVYAHAKGLDVLLAAKDFKAVRDSMLFLEKSGGYNFKGHMTDALWDEFKKAPESAPWRLGAER